MPAPVSSSLADDRAAIGWMHTARFLITAAELRQLPRSSTPEIAFVGRSNAGKSSAINTLTQQTRLAFSSRTPGRTRHINLFALGRSGQTDAVLADLPGYGYAAAPLVDKERWQRTLFAYLMQRESLQALVLLCDARHGLRDLDLALLEAIRPRVEHGLPFLVLLTKADKLSRAEQIKALSITRLQTQGGEVALFSTLKRTGIVQAARWIYARRAANPEPAAAPSV